MKTEKIEVNGKVVEIVTDFSDDLIENNDNFFDALEDTLDLTNEIKDFINKEQDNYE